MSRPTPPIYRTRNWPAYNEALKRRGSLTIWFDVEIIWDGAPTGRRGRKQSYSDAAIQTCLSMKMLFGMALRQTTGVVESLLRLAGDLPPEAPSFIMRVCGFGFHILHRHFGQARRVRSPQFAQAHGALQRVFGFRVMSAV
mgnify:FL=1